MKTLEQRAREAAQRVLDEHNPAGQLPVPVEHIAAGCGCVVARNQDPSSAITSFAVVSASQERVVGLNAGQGLRSQRFAVAHALGHHQMHRDRELTICRRAWASERQPGAVEADFDQEQAANVFAVELMMPAKVVMDRARNHLAGQRDPDREELVKYISGVFDAPAAAVAYRLVDLAILTP